MRSLYRTFVRSVKWKRGKFGLGESSRASAEAAEVAVSVTRGVDVEGRYLHVGQLVLAVRLSARWCVEESDLSEEGVHDGVLLVGGYDVMMNGERGGVCRSRHAPGVTHRTVRLLSGESGA